MTDTTITLTRENIAEAVFNRIFILDLLDKEAFIKRFCKCMEKEDITAESIVHVVSYCERSHDIVIHDFKEETSAE